MIVEWNGMEYNNSTRRIEGSRTVRFPPTPLEIPLVSQAGLKVMGILLPQLSQVLGS